MNRREMILGTAAGAVAASLPELAAVDTGYLGKVHWIAGSLDHCEVIFNDGGNYTRIELKVPHMSLHWGMYDELIGNSFPEVFDKLMTWAIQHGGAVKITKSGPAENVVWEGIRYA